MTSLTSVLARVVAVRLRDLGPRDTMGDMAECRSQWPSCIQNIFCSVRLFNLLFYS